MLCLESNDSLNLLLLDRRQFNEARENRLAGDRVVDAAAAEVQFVHYFAQNTGYLGVARAVAGRIGQKFTQTIVEQH